MAQIPRRRKRKLPEDIANGPDHEIMERIFGKRITKEVDSIVEDCREDDCFEKVSSIIKCGCPEMLNVYRHLTFNPL